MTWRCSFCATTFPYEHYDASSPAQKICAVCGSQNTVYKETSMAPRETSRFFEFADAHPELPYQESHLCFATVIECLKQTPDKRFARTGWNGKGMWISLQVPDRDSKMGRPYIYMRDAQGVCVPWLASQTDLLAHDWEMVG